MILKEEIRVLRDLLDGELREYISRNRDQYKENIIGAINYSLFTGGKRIRPILAMKSFELFSGEDYKRVLPYAMSIEMIHTYSLIHDDLPAMDDDDYRRGKPSSHKKFGEALAILAGDGLLNLAFEVVLDSLDEDSGPREIRALRRLAKYSGISGMINGQVVDLHLEEENITRDKIIYMYRTKTAALIEASLLVGSILADASEEELVLMEEFGYNLGMAYQIQDDFLDLEEDRAINKITYISVFGQDQARRDLEDFNARARASLNRLDRPGLDFFFELIDRLELRSI